MIQQLAIEASFDLLDLHASHPRRYPYLLESSAPGPQGRFDILFALPGDTIVLRQLEDFDFLLRLDERWRGEAVGHQSTGPLPFHGGWFLYLGYELAAQIEPKLRLPPDSSTLPIASATRIPAAIIHDYRTGRRWIVAEQETQAVTLMKDISRLDTGCTADVLARCDVEEDPPQAYLSAVQRILHYIREGDVFQVNLSRQWHGNWPQGMPVDGLYRQLRKSNPGP